MIKELKSVYYKIEDYFAEPYDESTNDWKEIKVMDLNPSKNEEKLEMVYANKTRKLQAKTRTGRRTGKITFKKGVDTSLIEKHLELISVALGAVNDSTATADANTPPPVMGAPAIVGGGFIPNAHYVTIGTDIDFTPFIGRGVKFEVGDDTVVPYNIIESATANTITLKFPVRDTHITAFLTGLDIDILKETVLGQPDTKTSFAFCMEYDDGSVEVFRGCGATAKLELNTEGLGVIDFEISSAIAGNRDNQCSNQGAFYSAISGTIDPEGEHLAVVYDFCDNYVSDLVDPVDAPKYLVAQVFSLSVANNLQKFVAQGGGTNNISQWYTEGIVTAEAEYAYTPDVLNLFGPANEASDKQYVYMSQSDFMIYSPANFTNETMGGSVQDTAKYNVDLNFSSTRECWLILPQ